MNKVAQVTLSFWIIKICATTLGETAGDLLSMTMNVGYGLSSVILIGLFLVSVVAQLMTSSFHPVLYWTVILTTSTAGTTMSDYMDRTLGLGYAKGSLILVTCLAIVLAVWRFSEKSLSVSNIQTTKAELFYCGNIILQHFGYSIRRLFSGRFRFRFFGRRCPHWRNHCYYCPCILRHPTEPGHVVLACFCADTALWSDLRRLADQTASKGWARVWHYRVICHSRHPARRVCYV